MKINNVNNSSIFKPNLNPKDEKHTGKKETPENIDSINISKEAKELAKQNQAEKIALIKERISNNYYNKKEVLEATAKAILKELNA